MNRGVRKLRIFRHHDDYRACLRVIEEARDRIPLNVFAYCLMPTHFHLVLQPVVDGQLSSFMQWFSATHSKRWHVDKHSTGTGCVYQSRFKAIPVQDDRHFLTVCRYVERNPLRADLVQRAEQWPWSSLAQRIAERYPIRLACWPVPQPLDWMSLVNEMEPPVDVARIREALRRNRPLGDQPWAEQMADRLATAKALRPTGRPVGR